MSLRKRSHGQNQGRYTELKDKSELRMPQKINHVIIDDSEYALTPAYVRGAKAFRNGVPFTANPYSAECQSHYDWDNGHTNESAGFHSKDGVDLLAEKRNGARVQFTTCIGTVTGRFSSKVESKANHPQS